MTSMSAPVIPVKSPLALSGVFISILRKRFHPEAGLPWSYLPGEDNRLTNTISIEAGANPLPEERNKRPAIYVIRNPITYREAVLGDRYSRELINGSQLYYATADCGFTFVVESNSEGEASQIADVVLCTLMMGSDIIERVFQFKKLGPFSQSSVVLAGADKTFAQVHISMGLTFDTKWATIPIAPILQEITAEATNGTVGGTEKYFTDILLQSFQYTE